MGEEDEWGKAVIDGNFTVEVVSEGSWGLIAGQFLDLTYQQCDGYVQHFS